MKNRWFVAAVYLQKECEVHKNGLWEITNAMVCYIISSNASVTDVLCFKQACNLPLLFENVQHGGKLSRDVAAYVFTGLANGYPKQQPHFNLFTPILQRKYFSIKPSHENDIVIYGNPPATAPRRCEVSAGLRGHTEVT